MGAGAPAKNATRCMAPAAPVFAGMPAPTPTVQASRSLTEAMAFTGMAPTPGQAQSLWERVNPRRMQRSAWHRLRRCSRACPLPHRPCKLQDPGRSHGLYRNGTNPGPGTIPVGAGSPAKNATQCLAPAVPVFAGKPAPTPTVPASRSLAKAMAFTEMAPTLGQAQSLWERARPRRMQHGAWHRPCRCSRACPLPHRPCKLQDPWPKPWPLQEWHQPLGQAQSLWERVHPRRMQRSAWHRLRRCSRACPLPHRPCKLQDPWPKPWPLQEWPPLGQAQSLWERVHPRRMQHSAWHRLCRCSRFKPHTHKWCMP